MADRAVTECEAEFHVATTYEASCTATVEMFRTGKRPAIDAAPPVDGKEILAQAKQAWRTKGDAHIALCHESLSGQGKMTKLNLEATRSHRKKATESKF